MKYTKNDMVGVAQLVELQIVVLAVAGSSPVAYPSLFYSMSFHLVFVGAWRNW